MADDDPKTYQHLSQAAIDCLVEMDGGAKMLPLEYPIVTKRRIGSDVQEETLSVVTIRRPKGADLRALNTRGDIAALALDRIARLTGLDAKDVDKLDQLDIERIGDVMESFT